MYQKNKPSPGFNPQPIVLPRYLAVSSWWLVSSFLLVEMGTTHQFLQTDKRQGPRLAGRVHLRIPKAHLLQKYKPILIAPPHDPPEPRERAGFFCGH